MVGMKVQQKLKNEAKSTTLTRICSGNYCNINKRIVFHTTHRYMKEIDRKVRL